MEKNFLSPWFLSLITFCSIWSLKLHSENTKKILFLLVLFSPNRTANNLLNRFSVVIETPFFSRANDFFHYPFPLRIRFGSYIRSRNRSCKHLIQMRKNCTQYIRRLFFLGILQLLLTHESKNNQYVYAQHSLSHKYAYSRRCCGGERYMYHLVYGYLFCANNIEIVRSVANVPEVNGFDFIFT